MFLFNWYVYYDVDCKEVIYFFKRDIFIFDFILDGINGFSMFYNFVGDVKVI